MSISVDGAAPKPFGPGFSAVELKPGMHTFRFIGARDCCTDKVLQLKVRPGPGRQVLSPTLKFRPASLFVKSRVPADVKVEDGLASGRANTLFNVPVERSLVETRRISVTAPGYRGYTGNVQLHAGQVKRKTVELQPIDEGRSL